MRAWLLAGVVVALMVPAIGRASSTPVSTIGIASRVVHPGQVEVITATARDLDGRPLVGARASAVVRYSNKTQKFTLQRTNGRGVTVLRFKAPAGLANAHVRVTISVTNGYISIPLTTQFDIRAGAAKPTATKAPARGSTPSPTPTRTSRPAATATSTPTATAVPVTAVAQSVGATATPVPSPTAPSQSQNISVVARAVPIPATPPSPLWVVAYVHTDTGMELGGAMVRVSALFQEGAISASGLTDASGAVSISVDTSSVRTAQTASILVTATWTSSTATTSFPVIVSMPAVTPTATAVPAAAPTAVPLPTATAAPAATPLPAPTLAPTSTPVPTDTPTATLVPTATATATSAPNCPGSTQGCQLAMLQILNATRAQYGVGPLTLNATQSAGTSTCIGSYGHSVHMAQQGQISHDQWPNDVCTGNYPIGENVGQSRSGDESKDLQIMHNMMMSEPHDAATCASFVNHACNIINPQYHQVGIGLYVAPDGGTWLTENFLG